MSSNNNHHDKFLSSLIRQSPNSTNKQFIRDICEYILVSLDADYGILFGIDSDEDEVYTYAVIGKSAIPGILAKEIRIPFNKGIAGWVAAHIKNLMLDATASDERYNDEKNLLSLTEPSITIIGLPLVCLGTLRGVLEITSRKKYTEPDIEKILPLVNALSLTYQQTDNALSKLAEVCIRFLEERDPYTHGHSLRVTNYSVTIAAGMGLNEAQKRDLRLAAFLHDIGKVTMKDTLLAKEQKLTKLEMQIIKMHPVIGSNIVASISKKIARLIRSHHECFNGSGYPDGLKGDQIPLVSRIICLADTVDAMMSNRPYRAGMEPDTIIKEISVQSGTQFDPKVVEIFLDAYRNGKIEL